MGAFAQNKRTVRGMCVLIRWTGFDGGTGVGKDRIVWPELLTAN